MTRRYGDFMRSASPWIRMGTFFIIIASFGLFVFLLSSIQRIDREEALVEKRLGGLYLEMVRAGMTIRPELHGEMADTAGLVSKLARFASQRDFKAAGLAVVEALERLGPHPASPSDPMGEAERGRLVAGLAESIERFLPILRDYRSSVLSSFVTLLLLSGIGFGLAIVYVFGLWTRLRESDLAADWSKRSLQRALEAEEAERRRIARELHDGAAQDLAAARMLCERAVASSDAQARIHSGDAASLLKSAGTRLRSLAMDLRPTGLEEGGLAMALESLCGRIDRLGQVKVLFSAAEDLLELGDEANIHVYRIAQEALSNAAKHARGNLVELRLESGTMDGAPGLNLVVRDRPSRPFLDGEMPQPEDGRPVPPETRLDPSLSSGTGLGIMAERASLIGGRLELDLGEGESSVRLFAPARRLRPPIGRRGKEEK